MFSAKELKAQIVRQGYTQERLAKDIGISQKTLYLKMKSGNFLTEEVSKIMEVLNIEDPVPIFFVKE